ncbi:MAG TPA: GNAT family N-acetyltransferase, partial [Chitinophagaceae bacterium]|nr:GNAT family N-acetyltransferase [Chitinophagaceae bacterium]
MDFDFTKKVSLENDRVLLRPLKDTDFENLRSVALNDPSIFRYSLTPITSEETLKEYIGVALTERLNKIRYPFIIYDKESNSYAGSTSIAAVSNKDKRLEIGWTWMGKAFQQTGLNRNCKYLLLHYAFEQMDFERVELKTDERNTQSRTAILKLGAKEE